MDPTQKSASGGMSASSEASPQQSDLDSPDFSPLSEVAVSYVSSNRGSIDAIDAPRPTTLDGDSVSKGDDGDA